MKVFVTGGAGFVGSTLCAKLLSRGDTVVAIDNFHDYYSPEQKRNNVKPLLENPNFTLYEDDFCKADVVDEIMEKFQPDAIAHMGAMANVRYSVKFPEIFTTVNINGTQNLLRSAVKYNKPHFVLASTSSIYGQRDNVPFYETDSTDLPLAPYPATKKAGELLGHAYVNMYGMTFTSLRFFNVYGPKGRPDMMPFKVATSILNDDEILLFNAGDMYRDWTFVDDVVDGVILAMEKPFKFEIFNIGRGEPVLMSDFMTMVQDVVGKKANIKNVPAPASDPYQTFASIDKAKKMLDYNPQTSLKEGYSKFWDWFQKNK